jgi:hypothetical protein
MMTQKLPFQLLIKEWVAMSDNRPVISDVQFAHLPGGSREVATGKTGKGSGYYVSRDPRVPVEVGGSEEKISGLTDPEAVKEHLRNIKGIAEKVVPTGWMRARGATPTESANVHQGTWKEDGKTYLDVTDRIGERASRSSLETALSRGISQRQLGVYAAGTGKTLYTHKINPEAKTRSGNKIPAYKPNEKNQKVVNPAAEMTLKYLKQQREESAQRRKVTPADKEKALTELKQAK